MAKTLDLSFNRIQFTPDLMPADIHRHGHHRMILPAASASSVSSKGPVFANIILADEISRAPAKTQSALLEAVQERRVTVMGRTFLLPLSCLPPKAPLNRKAPTTLPEAAGPLHVPD